MRYYDRERKNHPMLLLLTVSVMLLVFCCFNINVNAASGKITVEGSSYSDGAHNGEVANDPASIKIKAGNTIGYTIDFDSAATSVSLELSTNAGSAGTVEVRLDSSTGQLLATIEAEKTSTWTRRTETAKIDYEFSGKHKVWLCVKSGQADLHTLSFWVPGANGGNYPSWPGVDTYKDISNSEYREEINMLKYMKVFPEDGTEYHGKIAVTRGDFAIAMANLFDADAGSDAADIFGDIKKDDAYCQAITELLNLNIIKANAKAFRPTDFLTYDDAVSWMVSALGLDYQVKTTNLDRVIREMKLLDGIEKSGRYVTREQMSKLLVNTIFAQNSVMASFKPDDWYKFEEGDGILSYQGIYRGRGIVEANSYYNMTTNDYAADVTDVIIDGVRFNAGKTNAANYVGFEVDYLYKDGEGGKTLVGIMSSKNSSSMTLDSKDADIEKITEELITYYPEESSKKAKKINLAADTIIFYNDKLIDRSLESLIGTTDGEEFDGQILFISNDGNDRDYEVVKIYHMESIIFGGFKGNSVHDILTDTYIPFEKISDLLIFENGSLAEATAIPYETVLDVYRSKNAAGKQIFRAVVMDKEVEGFISKIDGEGNVILDNNNKYGIYRDFNTELTVGQEGIFKVNSYNDILGIKKAGDDSYALVLSAAISEFSGFDGETPKIKLYDLKDNTEKILNLAERVYLDGLYVADSDSMFDGGSTGFVGVGNLSENTLIRYRLNKSGKISLIDTPNTVQEGPRDVLKSVTNGSGTFKSTNGMLFRDSDYYAVCPVGSDVIWVTLNTYKGKTRITVSHGQISNSDDRNIEGFSTAADSKTANIIIENTTSSSIGGSQANAMIVTKVVTKWEDDEEQIYLCGMNGTSKVEYKVDKDAYESDETFKNSVDGAEAGDYILPYLFNGKILMGMRYVFMGDGKDANEKGVVSILNKDTNFDIRAVDGYSRTANGINVHGTIVDRDGDYILVRKGKDASAATEWFNTSKAGIIVCDSDGKVYSVDNKQSDLYMGIGEHVLLNFARWTYEPGTVVVYRSIDFGY